MDKGEKEKGNSKAILKKKKKAILRYYAYNFAFKDLKIHLKESNIYLCIYIIKTMSNKALSQLSERLQQINFNLIFVQSTIYSLLLTQSYTKLVYQSIFLSKVVSKGILMPS